MNLTVHIPDDAVPALKAKASGVPLEAFAEQVLLQQIREEGAPAPDVSISDTSMADSSIADAARRLGTFGRRHGLSLAGETGGMTIRELLEESRP